MNTLLRLMTKTPAEQRKHWNDYQRGFWDATVQIHKGPRMGPLEDEREYHNGHATGDGVYKQHQHDKRKGT